MRVCELNVRVAVNIQTRLFSVIVTPRVLVLML